MTEYFISTRMIDGLPRIIIVDEIGKIINRNQTKEELRTLKELLSTIKDALNRK